MNLTGPIALSTWAYVAAGAAALAVTAYIIKMRRRRFEVPFSELWKRVLEQKDANSLWKQLRRWLSLLITLLLLGVVLLAVLDPTLGGSDRRARAVVVLLDASASMSTQDGGAAGATTSRLDAAKRQAIALVDSMGGGDVAMIVKVDGQATPLSRFSGDVPMLRRAIEGVTVSETPADLTRALGAAADALRDRSNPLVVLISDGAFPEQQLGLVSWAPPADADAGSGAAPSAGSGAGSAWLDKNLAAVDLHGIDVRYVPVGRRDDNAGIIAFNVRRYVANKAAYEVFIEVQNFGKEPARRKLTLYNGDSAVDSRDLELAPGQRSRQIYRELPGGEDNRLRASLRPVDGAGGSDAFALDDQAYALLPARKRQRVLMVTDDNLYLEGAVLVYDNLETDKVTPAEYDTNPATAAGYDVVIFDDHTPAVLPPAPANLILFHPSGEHSPIPLRGQLARPRITELAEDHPVMRWITLSDVNFDRASVFALDPARGDVALARSVRDVVAVGRRDGGRKIAAFGFALPGPGREDATDLPLRVAFPLLLVNTLDWFAGDDADLITTYVTGVRQRVPLDGVAGEVAATVIGPGGAASPAPVADGVATFYAQQTGFHTLEVRRPPSGAPGAAASADAALASFDLAANLASAVESDIGPSADLTLGGKALGRPEAFAITRSRKLWIYLLVLALLIMTVEWVTYHRRITV